MSKSNYDKWIGQPHDGNRHVASARGASKKWTNRLGRAVEVLRSADEGIDGDGLPWLAVCVEHGSLMAVPTKASGVSSCRDTTQFCDACRAEAGGQ